MSASTIASISVATVAGELPAPVVFGDWIMKTREYVVVRVTLNSGIEGWAFTLTRDGAVSEQIRKTLKNIYLGTNAEDVEKTYAISLRRSLVNLSPHGNSSDSRIFKKGLRSKCGTCFPYLVGGASRKN